MEIPFGAAGTAWWWIRRTPAPDELLEPGTAFAPQYGA
jgi:hypothetical protein